MSDLTVDQGTNFGTWTDETSRWMYHDSLKLLIDNGAIDLRGTVTDYGGANGVLKKYVKNSVVTVDSDPTKQPDVVDDILRHAVWRNTGFCRYVMHYLTDQQVIQFCDNAAVGTLYIVQFVNEDLRAKYAASINETKYFRTQDQLEALLPRHASLMFAKNYTVTKEFYRNRLNNPNAKAHGERLVVYEIRNS